MRTSKMILFTASVSLLFFTLNSLANIHTNHAKLVLHNTSLSDSIGYTVTVVNNKNHASSSGGVIRPANQNPVTIQFSRKYRYPEATITIFNNASPQYLCKIILHGNYYYDSSEFFVPSDCVGLNIVSPQPGPYLQQSITVYLKTHPAFLKNE